MKEWNKKNVLYVFLVGAGCVFLYWLLHEVERVKQIFGTLSKMVSPFVIGAGIAFILNVPMRAIEKKLTGVKKDGPRRLLAVLITVVIVLLVIAGVFWLLIPQLVDTVQSLIPQIYNFIIRIPMKATELLDHYPRLAQWLMENTSLESMDWTKLAEQVVSFLGSRVAGALSSTVSAIGSITNQVFHWVFSIFVAVVFAIYCLFQKETLARQGRRLAYAFLSEKHADGIIRVLRLTNSTFSNFLSGQCIEVCILGTMFAVSMAILRMPYIPLVSVLIAVTAFIPIIGAWIGCVVGTFLILVVNPTQALWFVVMFVVLQQIENNLIYPKVVGTSIGLSGMWVLVAITIGGDLMGVAGMFLMIPLASVLYTLLGEHTNARLATRQIAGEKLVNQPPELKSNLREIRNNNREKRRIRILNRKKNQGNTEE